MVTIRTLFGLSALAILQVSANSNYYLNFTESVYSQNYCGADTGQDSSKVTMMPFDDCKDLQQMHDTSNLAGVYTFSWDTPDDVPEDTFAYGPWNGKCVIGFRPADYTQPFSIGNQDIYDIIGVALDTNMTTWASMPCKADHEDHSGAIDVEWQVGWLEEGFSPPGSDGTNFGNYAGSS